MYAINHVLNFRMMSYGWFCRNHLRLPILLGRDLALTRSGENLDVQLMLNDLVEKPAVGSVAWWAKVRRGGSGRLKNDVLGLEEAS